MDYDYEHEHGTEVYCNCKGMNLDNAQEIPVARVHWMDRWALPPVLALIRRDFMEAFEKCDAILTPTTPTPAFKAGEKADDPLTMYLSDIFTVNVNLAGICGVSVPCGFTKNPKLPIGLQLLGKPFGEETMLRVAHAYEQSTPWHQEKAAL